MIPYHRVIGNGSPLVVLHGVFGSSDNWQTVAKKLGDRHQVILVDLRNHGRSEHSSTFDFPSMSNDLIELLDHLSLKSANFLGHSLGGKAAMNLATIVPEKVEKLIIVDIAPKFYPPHHQKIFEGLKAVNLESLKSRTEADNSMKKKIPDFGVRQFLLKNLARDGDTFYWRLNVDAIEKNIEIVSEGLRPQQIFKGESLFIGGGRSDYINEDDSTIINFHFPHSEIKVINEAGHWIHAEKPDELINLILEFLSLE